MIASRALSMRYLRAATAAALVFSGLEAMAGVQASYLYKLSDFQGPVPSLWARVSVDPEEGEVYSLSREDAAIQIFNRSAMQTFGFGEGLNLASAADIAAGEGGEMYLLFSRPRPRVVRLDYTGAPVEEVSLAAAPADYRSFQPDFLDYKEGTLYLADSAALRVLVLSDRGAFRKGYDFRETVKQQILAELKAGNATSSREEQLKKELSAMENVDLTGFSADAEGTIYFTVASIFSAFRVRPGGKVEQFGVPGGAPGKFGVVAGIDADSRGNIYVADRLRCAVLVFDKELKFLGEFGYRGDRPQNLLVPDDIALDEQEGRIYVAQAANRGVSVFNLKFN